MAMFQAVDAIMKANKFKIVEQIECLKHRLIPQLKFIAKKVGTSMTGTKSELIYSIIWKYFDVRMDRCIVGSDEYHYSTLTADDLEQINDSYTRIYQYSTMIPDHMPYHHVIIERVLGELSLFYRCRYGPERMGVSLDLYLGSLNYTAIHFPMRLSHYERRLRIGEEAAIAAERDEFERINRNDRIEMVIQLFLREFLAQPQAQPQKLKFNVEVDATLNEAKECCICYENMMPVKLGCSHEMCFGCFCGIANSRKKSNPVITCAMCRADIDIVYVESETKKAELKQKIE
jgi:hypothetical protein